MFSIGGSQTFRIFAIAGLICFVCHVIVQIILDKVTGAYGKTMISTTTNTENSIAKLNKKTELDGEFKEVDLN
jgi:hypothetical protein